VLCVQFTLSLPAGSRHLALLRQEGIVNRRRLGQKTFYSLIDTGELLSQIVKGMCV
jgi:DNA-binding transcriptional ArsR family regulator